MSTTISSREFNQDIGAAKRAALGGPVIITDRNHPAYVLLSIDEYEKIKGTRKSIVDLLAMPGDSEIEFELTRDKTAAFRPVDLD